MKRIAFFIGIVCIAVLAIPFFILGKRQFSQDQSQPSETNRQSFGGIGQNTSDEVIPDEHDEEGETSASFSHGHGMAVDTQDSSKLYIATHYGVYVLENDTTLSKIGNSEDDFMGFTAHPSIPSVFFSSGHPKKGGNLGVLRSDDTGTTWKKISEGAGGPVDFHAIAVSPINTALMYGWHDTLQRSEDGGKSWKKIPTSLDPVYRLVAHPAEPETLFAANGMGLWVSRDRGGAWNIISDMFRESAALAFAVNPKNPSEMLSYGPKLKLAKSTDSGRTWRTIGKDLGGDVVYLFVYDPNTSKTVYAMTKNNLLFKSTNGGDAWRKLR